MHHFRFRAERMSDECIDFTISYYFYFLNTFKNNREKQ